MKLKLIIIHVKTIFAYKTYLSVKYRDKQIQKLSFSNTCHLLKDYEIRAFYLTVAQKKTEQLVLMIFR